MVSQTEKDALKYNLDKVFKDLLAQKFYTLIAPSTIVTEEQGKVFDIKVGSILGRMVRSLYGMIDNEPKLYDSVEHIFKTCKQVAAGDVIGTRLMVPMVADNRLVKVYLTLMNIGEMVITSMIVDGKPVDLYTAEWLTDGPGDKFMASFFLTSQTIS